MKKKYVINALIISSLLLSNITLGQKTGKFSTSFTFNGSSRELYYNVDPSYSSMSTTKHKLMIGLHGAGSSPSTFCGAWFTDGTLGPLIMACPSVGPDAGTSFCDVSGEDDGLLEAVINKVSQTYNIDKDYVIISGFSKGGRCGLQKGLEDPTPFRGMLLLAPAISFIADAQNTSLYHYENAKKIPLCMLTSSTDSYGYNVTNEEVKKQYELAGGKVSYTQFTNPTGHSVATSVTQYKNCMAFIENNPPLSIQDQLNEKGVSIYPNPSNGLLTVSAKTNNYNNLKISVYSMLGVQAEVFNTGFINGKAGLDLSKLNNGIYIVEVRNDELFFTQRITIQK